MLPKFLTISCVLAFFICADVTAGHFFTPRKLLSQNSQQSQQQYGNRRYGYNNGDSQLAANSRSIVNTQYAINQAVNSGANPRVTEAATYYGAANAYAATQANRNCGWYRRC